LLGSGGEFEMRIGGPLLFASLCAGTMVLGEAALAQPALTPPVPRIYENVSVLGVLDCKIKGDIRLIAGADKSVECDYQPRGLPDVHKGYSGYVRTLREGFFYRDGDFLCWTVLHLEDVDTPYESAETIKGPYSTAAPSVEASHELKAGSLVGGSKKAFALEPRCVVETRAGRNIADSVEAFELVD
jgi:hypothetical protein